MASSSSPARAETSVQSPSISDNAPTASVSAPFHVPVDERLVEPLLDSMEGLQISPDARPLPSLMSSGNASPVHSNGLMSSGNASPVHSNGITEVRNPCRRVYNALLSLGNASPVNSNDLMPSGNASTVHAIARMYNGFMSPGNASPVHSNDIMPSENIFLVQIKQRVQDAMDSGRPVPMSLNGILSEMLTDQDEKHLCKRCHILRRLSEMLTDQDGKHLCLRCHILERRARLHAEKRLNNHLKAQIGTDPKQFRRRGSCNLSTDAGPSSGKRDEFLSRIRTDFGTSGRSPLISTDAGPTCGKRSCRRRTCPSLGKGSCRRRTCPSLGRSPLIRTDAGPSSVRGSHRRTDALPSSGIESLHSYAIPRLLSLIGPMHSSIVSRLLSRAELPGVRSSPLPPIQLLRDIFAAQGGELTKKQKYCMLKGREAMKIILVRMRCLLHKKKALAKQTESDEKIIPEESIKEMENLIRSLNDAVDFYNVILRPKRDPRNKN